MTRGDGCAIVSPRSNTALLVLGIAGAYVRLKSGRNPSDSGRTNHLPTSMTRARLGYPMDAYSRVPCHHLLSSSSIVEHLALNQEVPRASRGRTSSLYACGGTADALASNPSVYDVWVRLPPSVPVMAPWRNANANALEAFVFGLVGSIPTGATNLKLPLQVKVATTLWSSQKSRRGRL